MAVTHTWGLVRAEHETATNKLKSIHWKLESADGDYKAYSCGEVVLSSSVVLPYASLTTNLLVNAAKNALSTSAGNYERNHEDIIEADKAATVQYWTD